MKIQIPSRLALLAIILIAIGCVTESAKQQAQNRQPDSNEPSTASQEDAASDDGEPNINKLIYEAQANSALGRFEEAEALVKKLIELQPEDTRHYMLYANMQLITGDIDGALKNYDQVIQLKPELKPYLWQRGLALYYLDQFEAGIEQFESHQTISSQDVENSVWHMLCEVRLTDLETARKQMIPIEGDNRIPMKEVFEMFAGRATPEQVVEAAANSADLQRSLYYAYLYQGLYYEMTGDSEKSISAMESAEKAKTPTLKDNLMNQLASIHLRLRKTQTTEDCP